MGLQSRPLRLVPTVQVVQDRREHLHCMHQTATRGSISLIQRVSAAFRVCAASYIKITDLATGAQYPPKTRRNKKKCDVAACRLEAHLHMLLQKH